MRGNRRPAGRGGVLLRWLLALAMLGGLLALRFLWPSGHQAVSYTHLTLPPDLRVEI